MTSPAGTVGASSWLRSFRAVAEPRLRLICLPHAGGTASFYRRWTARLPSDVEVHAVCYPGRQERLDEPCIERMDELADRVTEAIAPFVGRPLALFGHSMGASVAYEVTLRLEARFGVSPVRLFVSGREAPHRTAERGSGRDRTDEELLHEVRGLGEFDRGILDNPEIRELILPALRADYRLIGDYRLAEPTPVRAPITAYAGISDPGCAIPAARAWSDVTTGGFEMRIFPGDHFFLVPAEAELVHDLSQRLA